jgi:hypothetical protein
VTCCACDVDQIHVDHTQLSRLEVKRRRHQEPVSPRLVNPLLLSQQRTSPLNVYRSTGSHPGVCRGRLPSCGSDLNRSCIMDSLLGSHDEDLGEEVACVQRFNLYPWVLGGIFPSFFIHPPVTTT